MLTRQCSQPGEKRYHLLSPTALCLVIPIIISCSDGPIEGGSDGRIDRVASLSAASGTADGGDLLVAQSSASPLSLTLPFAGATPAGTGSPSFWIIQRGDHHSGLFVISNTLNPWAALGGSSNGRGAGVQGGNSGIGPGGFFHNGGSSNVSPALKASTTGRGPVLLLDHQGTTGALAEFQVGGVNRIRFSRSGRGFFNGGTQTGGADVAEAFEVEGTVKAYEPGDVLAISEESDRTVEKSDEPYSTRVIGVYATKPGVLLTERDIDANLDDMVPVGVVGVIPTKVSAENGAIRRGDLLVTARTPGHAMAADPDRLRFGMGLGKALQGFEGPGTGTIKVLVNVK